MFLIGITQKAANEINKPVAELAQYSEEATDICQWHMDIVTINRRKCLILINNETGLNLTLFGLRKQQFENIDHVIRGSLKQLFQLLEVKETVIEYMLKQAEELYYAEPKSEEVLSLIKEVKLKVEEKTKGLSYEEIDAVAINFHNNCNADYPGLDFEKPYEMFAKYFQ